MCNFYITHINIYSCPKYLPPIKKKILTTSTAVRMAEIPQPNTTQKLSNLFRLVAKKDSGEGFTCASLVFKTTSKFSLDDFVSQ